MGRLTRYGDVTYKYDTSGIRLEKTSGGVSKRYITSGDRILAERDIINKNYIYDEIGPCAIIVYLIGVWDSYYLKRDCFGNITEIFDAEGKTIGTYQYDAWGNCTMSKDSTYGEIAYNDGVHVHVGDINVLRWRGYYYDDETGLYFINGRWYDPETCRYLSPTDHRTLATEVLGQNSRYSYANNNPVGIAYSSFRASENIVNSLINQSFNLLAFYNLGIVENKTGSSVHWKNEWLATDLPSFFVFSNKKAALIDWGLSVYKGSLYFDEAENHSIYVKFLSFSSYAGYNVEEKKVGIFADANVLSVGFDGKYIDAGISVIGVGFICGWVGEKFIFKIDPPGWFGFEIAIDFGDIRKDLFGR